MFDGLNIPPPALPGGAEGMLIGLAAIVAGLVLLAFGRIIVWRVAAALLLAPAGLGIGWAIALAAGTAPSVPMLVVALLLAAVGASLARLWWALLLGGAAASLALLIVIQCVPTDEAAKAPQGFTEALAIGPWLGRSADIAWQWLTWLAREHPLATALTAMPLTLLGLAVGLARPLFSRIAGTSAAGAAAAVTGGCIMAESVRTGLDVVVGWRGWLALLIAVLLAGAGSVYQWRAHARGRKKVGEQDSSPPQGAQRQMAEVS